MKERRRKKGRTWGFSAQSTITLDTRTIIAGCGVGGGGGEPQRIFELMGRLVDCLIDGWIESVSERLWINCSFLLAGRDRAQELCESRGGRPGLPSLISLRFLWT